MHRSATTAGVATTGAAALVVRAAAMAPAHRSESREPRLRARRQTRRADARACRLPQQGHQ
eukprot:2637550-Prymnesium_polylepis.2